MIAVDESLRKVPDFLEALTRDRDQLWAEAVVFWKRGEKLYLPLELEKEARARQSQYNDDSDDPLRDMLAAFLDTRLPADWDTWDLNRRRAYMRNPDPLDAEGVVLRERVCAAEFICERMGREMSDKEYKYLSRRVCRLLDEMGWERRSTARYVRHLYGRQKSFSRPLKLEENDDDEL